jgi:hypothetical protein
MVNDTIHARLLACIVTNGAGICHHNMFIFQKHCRLFRQNIGHKYVRIDAGTV